MRHSHPEDSKRTFKDSPCYIGCSTEPRRVHEHDSARKKGRQPDGKSKRAHSGCAVEIDLEQRKRFDCRVNFTMAF